MRSSTARFSWVRRHRVATQNAQNGCQQGRSEQRGESYSVLYVEPLSDARTRLADFFSILLDLRHRASHRSISTQLVAQGRHRAIRRHRRHRSWVRRRYGRTRPSHITFASDRAGVARDGNRGASLWAVLLDQTDAIVNGGRWLIAADNDWIEGVWKIEAGLASHTESTMDCSKISQYTSLTQALTRADSYTTLPPSLFVE